MISTAVVDASVAAKWVLAEAGSHHARLLSQVELEAPDLLFVECANILWKKVRLGDLRENEAISCLEVLLTAPVRLVPSLDLLVPALGLSLRLKHPVYDCIYLALAVRSGWPLISADQKFVEAVRRRKAWARHIKLLDEVQ